MPTITLDLAKGISLKSEEQKQQMIDEITETMSRLTGFPKEAITIFFRVHDPHNVSVGGVRLSDLEPGNN